MAAEIQCLLWIVSAAAWAAQAPVSRLSRMAFIALAAASFAINAVSLAGRYV